MKLWRCLDVMDPDGHRQSWHPSKRAAMAARIEHSSVVSGIIVEAVEIPTDKAGLIKWLNDNFDMDNG